VTFGLVNVPVKVYSATEDHDVPLHQVHDKDGGRIKYQRRCEVCGRIVDFDHIDRAFDDGDRTVILTQEDLSDLPEERSHEIEVVEFIPSDQLDPIMLDRSYFLEPDSRSPKAYALLRKTLEKTDRTAIVHGSALFACTVTSSCCSRCSGMTRCGTRSSRVSPRRCG
jgi:DNA end-binding protein Ku